MRMSVAFGLRYRARRRTRFGHGIAAICRERAAVE